MSEIGVRTEENADRAAVEDLVRRAFAGELEARLVSQLHADGDAIVSLVATEDGAIVGHILFSRLAAPFRALALAPLCVAPDRQHRGIGSRLVRAGLEWAREAQWDAVFVLGDPAYYRRFGFALEPARSFDSPYAGEHFMMLALRERIPAGGALTYPKAFEAL